MALEVQNLSYTYPDGTQALDGISLKVMEGEKVALVGPNGAGKSTLLLHLNGIKRGDGEVRVFGLPVAQSTLRRIRQQVGLVFQDPQDQLFCPTVFEDVAFGPLNLGLDAREVHERVHQALAEVEMERYEQHSSFHLSSGEQKRIAIATILSVQPEILVIDEPSSNLDPKHRRKLISFFQKSTKSLVLASHDLDLVLEVCRRCIVLNRGRIVAEGIPAVILKDRALLEANGLELPLSFQHITPACEPE
jgi:cobalt/nickel transport system ATP-binding protein